MVAETNKVMIIRLYLLSSPYWMRGVNHMPSADGLIVDCHIIVKEEFENREAMVRSMSLPSLSVQIL